MESIGENDFVKTATEPEVDFSAEGEFSATSADVAAPVDSAVVSNDVTSVDGVFDYISNDVPPTAVDTPPLSDDVTPAKTDISRTENDDMPAENDVQSISDDVTPAIIDVQPFSDGVTPATIDVQHLSVDIAPAVIDVQPLSDDVTAEQSDVQQIPDDALPAQIDVQPVSDEIIPVVYSGCECRTEGDNIDEQFAREEMPTSFVNPLAIYPDEILVTGDNPDTITGCPNPYRLDLGPDSHLRKSILVTICCFFPTGLLAVYFASKVEKQKREGNMEAAKQYSRKAWMLIIASLAIGIPIFSALTIYITVGLIVGYSLD